VRIQRVVCVNKCTIEVHEPDARLAPAASPQRAANATIVLQEDAGWKAEKAWQTRFEHDAHGVARVAIVSGAAAPAAPAPRPPSRQPVTDTRTSYDLDR